MSILTMTIISIFDIPPIQDGLASYLTPSDLAQCARVSRSWSAAFVPCLYRSIDITTLKTLHFFETPETLAALTRHSCHVRTFRTCYLSALKALAPSLFQGPTSFRNLDRFHWRDRKRAGPQAVFKDEDPLDAIDFLEAHRSIREVHLSYKYLRSEFSRRLTRFLASRNVQQDRLTGDSVPTTTGAALTRRLRRVRINYVFLLHDKEIFDLSIAAAGPGLGRTDGDDDLEGDYYLSDGLFLEQWHLVQTRGDYDDRGDYEAATSGLQSDREQTPMELAWADDTTDLDNTRHQRLVPGVCRWRDLSLDCPSYFGYGSVVLQALRCSPQLERLSWLSIEDMIGLQELPYFLQQKCPRIRHLVLGRMPLEATDEDLAAVFEAVVGGLISFKAVGSFLLHPISIESLHYVHGSTLTHLDMLEMNRYHSLLFLELITGLPSLQSLKATVSFSRDFKSADIYDMDGVIVDYTEMFERDWPFRDHLKELYLAVFRGNDMEADEKVFMWGDGSLTDQFTVYLSSQIGALHRLESLEIGGWMLMLRKDAHMKEMAGLKRLKYLDMSDHNLVRWAKSEADWICENWPALVEIKGLKSHHHAVAREAFLKNRPWILFS
ncbi:hypothetical protein EMPS_07300 [Entomortierella parvispora]|uniref:F-box domain-containing protein n=1 Tax=Entomortierella parvispora TaxID=205924 RepID=A0A9P3HEN8_9FUNG|nr:hypothetical protein EMPS_07300 [Entomortierella parvispora]